MPFPALDEAVTSPRLAPFALLCRFASLVAAPLTQQFEVSYGELRIGFMRHLSGNGQNNDRIIFYGVYEVYDNVKAI